MERIQLFLEHAREWISTIVYGILMGVLFMNIRGIIDAFKGDDQKWDIHEIGKAVIIGCIIYMVHAEGTRDHEWHVYNEYTFMTFVFGLFLIAQVDIKEIINYIKNGKSKE